MKETKNVKIFKFIMLIIVIGIFLGMVAYLFPVMKDLSTAKGQIAFKQKIDNSGIYGLLILFGLQVAQIFLVIVPGEPIEIMAGMCYGTFWGTIFIMVSVFIITTGMFFLVRKFGKKLVYSFCNENQVKKIENSKLFQNPKKIEFIMMLLFFIPGAPKDLLIYTAALLPIKPSRFILIATFARFPSIISSTWAGANLIVGNWKISIAIYAIILAIVALVVGFINLFDKNKTTEGIFKELN